MHLYDSTVPSGDAYKVHLQLSQLGTSYKVTSLHILPPLSESHKSDFLAINPNGKVPALKLDDGTVLAESNAILFYLAEGTPYLPDNRVGRAQVLQCMFFEQFSGDPYVAKWKFRTYWASHGFSDLSEAQVKQMRDARQSALDVMETHLSQEGREWFVGRNYSIADIALFAYTQHAEILGFKVGEIMKGLLRRVESTKGWIRIGKDLLGRTHSDDSRWPLQRYPCLAY